MEILKIGDLVLVNGYDVDKDYYVYKKGYIESIKDDGFAFVNLISPSPKYPNKTVPCLYSSLFPIECLTKIEY